MLVPCQFKKPCQHYVKSRYVLSINTLLLYYRIRTNARLVYLTRIDIMSIFIYITVAVHITLLYSNARCLGSITVSYIYYYLYILGTYVEYLGLYLGTEYVRFLAVYNLYITLDKVGSIDQYL